MTAITKSQIADAALAYATAVSTRELMHMCGTRSGARAARTHADNMCAVLLDLCYKHQQQHAGPDADQLPLNLTGRTQTTLM